MTLPPRGNVFPEAILEGHRCDCLPSVGSCTQRGTFLFPELPSAVGSEFHVRLTRDRDNDDEAPRGFSGGGIGGTTLRLFTVGRIMCETGYFPVSQATFGCWVKISQETYTGPGQHLRAGITTGHPRQRWDEIGYGRDVCLFQRKTNRLPYARPGGPLLPTIPEGFSPPLDPCPSVCEGGVHCF